MFFQRDTPPVSSARSAVERARHHARRPLARTPYLWDLAMYARPSRRATLVTRNSAIVIEGFPRSGNTFSAAAFALSNPAAGHVGRHLHAPGHVLRGVRLGVPTVVLIRPPRDAILSEVVRRAALTPHDAVLEYLDFYRTAWPVRDGFVTASFHQVITDFGAVLDHVNAKFGTSFARYEHTPANQAAAFELVEQMNRLEFHGELVETHTGRPSHEREMRKAAVRAELDHPRTASQLRRADELYAAYVTGG
jgi:hypothetical protein